MVVGFNHNFRYRGEVFHVQTEDGGLKNPNIITLLYRGGTILASKKTSYADITRADHLEKVVEDLMKEQHKEMLRRLRGGELDDLIAGRRVAPAEPASPDGEPVPPVSPPAPDPAAGREEKPPPASEPSASAAAKTEEKQPEPSLDDVILSYLVGED